MEILKDYSRKATLPTVFRSDIITITGESKVGSSTTVQALLSLMGGARWKHVSAGETMRKFAADKGMTIERFSEYMREHPEMQYDIRCDEALAKEARKGYRISDGRVQHAMVPEAFHVRLECPVIIRASRQAKDLVDVPQEELMRRIVARDQNDMERYKQYPNCLWSNSDYDYVADTSEASPFQIAYNIFAAYEEWKQRVFPTKPVPA